MALPQLTGTARLTADPELRYSPSGVAVCAMHLAFNSRKQDPSGAWVDGDALFIKATAFKDLAEHCAESLTKGAEVIVVGWVKTEQWETRTLCGCAAGRLRRRLTALAHRDGE